VRDGFRASLLQQNLLRLLPEAALEEENGVRVVVSVVGARAVGLTILEDGQRVYDQVTTPGFSEEFQAEEAITVNAAEGDVVQVGVNGENPEPLGTSGEWTTRTFTAESQS
jgi:threonine dehydrogenase-like Zn-dependent dehydrogenase